MSFVRFGADSQVYIYDDVRGYKICCFCGLAKITPAPTEDDPDAIHWDDFHTTDLDAMLAHVGEHRAAGHMVPKWVDQALRDEWETP